MYPLMLEIIPINPNPTATIPAKEIVPGKIGDNSPPTKSMNSSISLGLHFINGDRLQK